MKKKQARKLNYSCSLPGLATTTFTFHPQSPIKNLVQWRSQSPRALKKLVGTPGRTPSSERRSFYCTSHPLIIHQRDREEIEIEREIGGSHRTYCVNELFIEALNACLRGRNVDRSWAFILLGFLS